MKEEFKLYTPVDSTTVFEVSNFGTLRNTKFKKFIGSVDPQGYKCFQYKKINGSHATMYIGRLVVMLFLPPPKEYSKQVIYRDGNRSNCHVSNMMWATKEHYQRIGKSNLNKTPRALGLMPRRLFSDDKVREIRKMEIGISQIAMIMRVRYQIIYNIRKGKTYKNVK